MSAFAPLREPTPMPTDTAPAPAADPALSARQSADPADAAAPVDSCAPPVPPAADDSTPDLTLPPRSRLRLYAELAKIRLNGLVVVTTLLGFLLVSHAGVDGRLLLWTLLGTALLAGGSSTFNQLLEVHRDALMKRTRNRPLVTGTLSRGEAVAFGLLTTMAGAAVLLVMVNSLTALLGVITWFVYVAVYTPLKTRSTVNTLVGGICGALPPMMGVTAVTGALTLEAWILGAILFVWQVPHFLALAWLCRRDYEAAGYRMLPMVDPTGHATARQTLLYTLALVPLTLAAPFAQMTGLVYLVGALLLGAWLTRLAVRFYRQRDNGSAKALFLASVLYLPLLLTLMVLDRQAPPPAIVDARPAEYHDVAPDAAGTHDSDSQSEPPHADDAEN